MLANWAPISGAVTLLLLLGAAIIAIFQFRILQVRHRLDTAPFVRFDIEASVQLIPTGDPRLEKEIIKIPALKKWAEASPRARHRYMIVTLHNRQTHIASVATDVRFRIVFRFPKYGTPNTMIRVRRYVKGLIWLEPTEVYRLVFADLKGVPAATIDIDEISYYDVDGNKYRRGYGYSHWELDNTGVESQDFREFR